MLVTDSIQQVRTARWADPSLQWGFVPTMGYLHAGHLALVQRAQQENDRVAVSIYINPTQFAPGEDLTLYPRNLEQDVRLLQEIGCDLVFTPGDHTMYPAGYQTYVQVEGVTQHLEGASRPTHFRGVATIVAKLFNILQPQRAYFGQKDYQQTVVLRRLVQDLNFPLTLVVCPTVREADGLALSSRNSYLSPSDRAAAPIVYRALLRAREALAAGERQAQGLRRLMQAVIAAEPRAHLDYISVADPETLVELEQVAQAAVLSLAVYFGRTRLIDNLIWPDTV